MSLILALETATPVCSVALSRGQEILSIRETTSPNAHSSALTLFIEEVFRECSLSYSELDAVAVSIGPGSYTGLRIGVATAKGLCYALDKPLIAVHTLEAMAAGMKDEKRRTKDEGRETGDEGQRMKAEGQEIRIADPGSQIPSLFCPMIDARRMEVYCAVYDANLAERRPADAVIVEADTFDDLLAGHSVIFAGNGAEKCRDLLADRSNATFMEGFRASARYMIPLGLERFSKGNFGNLAYLEPFYLKDFVAGKPNVKGLR